MYELREVNISLKTKNIQIQQANQQQTQKRLLKASYDPMMNDESFIHVILGFAPTWDCKPKKKTLVKNYR